MYAIRSYYGLQVVYEEMLSYHLSQSAEGAKIALSSVENTEIQMDYLERGLTTNIDREQFKESIDQELTKFIV